MSVEGKREGEVLILRMVDKRDRHTVGVILAFLVVSLLGPTQQTRSQISPGMGPRNVSIWRLRKINISEILICRQPSGQR